MIQDDEFLSQAGQLLSILKGIKPREYWLSQLPSVEDGLVAQASDLYNEATLPQKEVFLSALSEDISAVLSYFASRMAMLSVRQSSETVLMKGLIALIIKLDWWLWLAPRELMFDELILVHQSANKLRTAPDRLFAAAAVIAFRKETKKILYDFLQIADSNGHALLYKAGWEAIEGPAGLIYHYGGQPIPDGHLMPGADHQSDTRV